VEAVWEQIRPAVVFHLAGYGVDRAEREDAGFRGVNVQAVEHAGRAAAKYHDPSWPWVQFVHAGSVAEYGPIGGSLVESSRENPATLYGKSKLAGTRALAGCCAETGLRGVTARLATVYGPGEHPGRLLPSLLEAAAGTEPICLSEGFQKRDFTYVEDVAEALIRLAVTRPTPGDVVNVVTGELTTVRSFAQTAARVLGISPTRLLFGALPVRYEEEMQHGPISNLKLKELTGWAPSIAIEEGIRRTVNFLAQCAAQESHG
jgi:nucleoside-diphosphate-sugar epimerase